MQQTTAQGARALPVCPHLLAAPQVAGMQRHASSARLAAPRRRRLQRILAACGQAHVGALPGKGHGDGLAGRDGNRGGKGTGKGSRRVACISWAARGGA